VAPRGTPQDGNQTFARGLRALLAIVDSERGMSVHQVGDLLGVHRSIAYRLLQTLVDYDLVARSRDGIYFPGDRLASLARAYLPDLRASATPVMRVLADALQSTVSLFVEQNGEAVSIAMVEPTTATHHISFRPGMRTPMDRGAAAYAIRALAPPAAGELEQVAHARELGYASSHGEIEGGAYGIAAPIPADESSPHSCLLVITYRPDVAERAGEELRKAAARVNRQLRAAPTHDIAPWTGGEKAVNEPSPDAQSAGSLTLARGLRAFLALVAADGGMTVQQMSDHLEVHRTIAYRLLQTLVTFGLVARTASGAFVIGARAATLADAYVPRLQDVAQPIMQQLADAERSTVLLFTEHNGEAVAVSLCEPTTAVHHIAFRAGMRTPMDRGAAAFALRAARDPLRGEPAGVTEARASGVARSRGAVLPGAYGVAAPIMLSPGTPPACLMLVTYLDSVADSAAEALQDAAASIGTALQD
jgi:DNA-binding IclR family transcriptional regulator